MAELAGGAVRSLLSVIRNEAQLLGGVAADVQFIKEEMESMNSFLAHLVRKTPRSGEHNEQVSTWMKQVRDLANDCSNSIDIYLQRHDPAVYRHRGILLGYVWWVPWFVKKTLAQHHAATQLRDLKARARDVGERRLRYGVELPAYVADSGNLLMSPTAAEVAEEDHDFEDVYYRATNDDDPRRELAFSNPRLLLKCTETLMNWLERQHEDGQFQAIAIAAPDEEDGNDLIEEALNHDSVTEKFDHAFVLEDQFCPKEPREFLGDMLEALEDGKSAEESGEEDVHDSISMIEEEIDEKISKIEEKIEEHLEKAGNKGYRVEPIGLLRGILQVLLQDAAVIAGDEQTQEKTILEDTAEKMKKYVESADEKDSCTIDVLEHHPEFVAILQDLLPKQATAPAKAAMDKPGEDHIVKNIRDIMLPVTSFHQQDKSVEEYCGERIKEVLERIKEHLLIQETTGRVREHLQGKMTLVVIKNAYGYKWEETSRALRDLRCSSMAVVVTTKYMQSAHEFCYGAEPIVYSSIEYNTDKALQLTNRHVNDDDRYSAAIFHEILGKCRLDVLCTKMFIHALFTNPMRRREELIKMSNSLVFGGSPETNGYKLIKFSFNDLPRDYKTCFLYLAIFHEGEKINRTRLVGRWVAEGFITRQDWNSSVSHAERCFDVLVDLWLVNPSDYDVGGKVKSITLNPVIYNFVGKMAKKEQILDKRLSRHLARHFSISSNIQLRPSESIHDFLKQLSNVSPQLMPVKALDLEGWASLRREDNQRWLRSVCTSLILLKYLSLRDTGVTQLPKEINRLQQLEVLDIRRTPIHVSATKKLMLLRLKRLLAGGPDANILSTVHMPHKVWKMRDLEVLSHVQASKHHAARLREIGKLWQLRVFSVVIYDWKEQLDNLLQGISNLNECLVSLSIEIKHLPARKAVATPPDADAISAHCKNTPKLLESLSISGVTMYGRFLQFFTRGCRKLAKVTLHNTLLDQDDMESLADLPNLRGLKLRHVKLYSESKLIIQTNGFQNLKCLLVEGGGITDIDFETGEAPKLEKIVLLTDEIKSLLGINNLPKLKEMVFNNGIRLPEQVKEAIEAHPNFIDNKGIW